MEFCVEISQGEAFVLRRLKKKERCDTVELAVGKRCMRARLEAGGSGGVMAEQFFGVSDFASRIGEHFK